MSATSEHPSRGVGRVGWSPPASLNAWLGVWLCASLGAPLVACAPEPAPPEIEAAIVRAPEAVVRVVGDEATTPLLRQLVAAFAARAPGEPVVVEAPLAPAGARRALAAGRLDALLVLAAVDAPPGAGARAIATTMPTLVVGAGVADRRLTAAALATTLAGEPGAWPDGLSRRVFLPRSDEPASAAYLTARPDWAAAVSRGRADGNLRTFHRLSELADSLRHTPGALAILDSGGLRLRGLPVWPVEVIDAPPQVPLFVWLVPRVGASVEEGRFGRLEQLVTFFAGPDGRALAVELGYGALPEASP